MTTLEARGHTAITAIQSARTLHDLNEAMAGFALAAGCSHYLLAPGPDNPSEDPAAWLGCGNYPALMSRRYLSEKTCLNDPARRLAIKRANPVTWRRAFLNVRDEAGRSFIAEARNHGLRDGVTAAVHGPKGCMALLMLATAGILILSHEDEETVSLVALAAHQRMRRLVAASLVTPPSDILLTGRERQCLHWVLEGKTNWEIGVLTGVTARTVQFHLANAQRKLGASNRTQAGVKALIRGLISPPGEGQTPLDDTEGQSDAA
jgi:DNA-binding CsgD family transcriptional regulator